jgi:hypothetical protein
MDQIPKAASGMMVIGQKRNELFAPPEDGIIVPNRLMAQVPHRDLGGPARQWGAPSQIVTVRRGVRSEEAAVASLVDALEAATPAVYSFADATDDSSNTLADAFRARGIDPDAVRGQAEANQQASEQARQQAQQEELDRRRDAFLAGRTRGNIGQGRIPQNMRTPAEIAAFDVASAAAPAGETTAARAVPPPLVPPGLGGAAREPQQTAAPRAATEGVEGRAAAGAPGAPAPSMIGRLSVRPGSEALIQQLLNEQKLSEADIAENFPQHASLEGILDKKLSPEARSDIGFAAASLRHLRTRDAELTPDPLIHSARMSMAGASGWMAERNPKGMAAVLGGLGLGGGQEFKRRQQILMEERSAYAKADRAAEKWKFDVDKLTIALKTGVVADEDRIQVEQELKESSITLAAADETRKKHAGSLLKAQQAAEPTQLGIARNFLAIIASTSAYGAAMSAANELMAFGKPALESWVDSMMGFTPTMTRVTTALAKQTREQGGNYEAAIASAAATAGLSGEMTNLLTTTLKGSVVAKSAAQSYVEASDLMRGMMGVKAGQAPQGLYGGYGGLGGTALFAEGMGGGKGLLEQLAGNVRVARGATGGDARSMAGGYQDLVGQIPIIGGFEKDIVSAWSNPLADVINQITGAGDFKLPAAAGETFINEANKAIGRAASRNQETNVPRFEAIGKEAQKDISQSDLPEEYKALAEAGFALVDPMTGLVTKFDELNSATSRLAEGMTIIDFASFAKTMERQFAATLFSIDFAGEMQRNIIIPTQFAMQRISQPYLPAGAGITPIRMGYNQERGARLGIMSGSAGQYAGYLGAAPSAGGLGLGTGLSSKLGGWIEMAGKSQFNQERAAWEQIGQNYNTIAATQGPKGGKAAADEYMRLINSAQATSTTIENMATNVAELNRVASQTSWANTTRLALRGIADAAGMIAGAAGKKGGSLFGNIEGQLYRIGRASQKLTLELQQRSITTQLALAQFQAPGETGEERYARQKEAQIKAGIEQTQLGFATQTYDLAGKQWAIAAQRAAEDAQKAWSAAKAAFAAQTAAATAAQTTAVLEADMAQDLGKAGSKLSDATSKMDASAKIIESAMATYGKSLEEINTEMKGFNGLMKGGVTGLQKFFKAWGIDTSQGAKGAANGSGSSGGGTWDNGSSSGIQWSSEDQQRRYAAWAKENPKATGAQKAAWLHKEGVPGYASGYLGVANRATSMIVGEAGPETIAVIRNARSVTMGGGVADVKLVESSIASWVKAFTVAFPKVTLTDKSVKDIKDGFTAAAKDIVGTPATGDAKKKSAGDGSQIKSYDTSMPKNERLDRFATALSKKTGLSFEASRKWAQAEVGEYNNLGIMTTNAQGKRVPMRYATPELGATAAAQLINSSGNYAGIRASTGGSTLQQLIAIANSPWHEGFKPGIDPYYKRIFGLKAQGDLGHTMGATPMIVGEAGRETVAILRNPRSSAMSSMGGSSGPVTININGPVVRNDQDISSLAHQVAIEVERSLSRKGQMFGLRGPAV